MLLPGERWRDGGLARGTRSGWRVGEIEVDSALGKVSRLGVPLVLDRSGYALLQHLVEHAGRTVSKDELLGVAWPGRVVSENSLAKAIGKLRQALGDDAAEIIQVVHGYGYRLIAEVEPLALPRSEVSQPGVILVPAPAARPMHWLLASLALLLTLIAVLAVTNRVQRPAPAPPPSSRAAPAGDDVIAVLPFRDASPNGSLALFADGIGNHLRDQLQRMPALRFISRADSQALRGDPREPVNIAHDLGANLIIDGQVSHAGDQLRVEIRMFDARGRIPAWSRTFERPPYDQATLLEDLRAAVFTSIGRQKGRWGLDPQRGRGTANEEAFRSFLRAATLFTGNNDPTINAAPSLCWSRPSSWIRTTPMPGSP